MGTHYALDGAHQAAPDHLSGLAGLHDPDTCQRILTVSGGDLTGWQCWEAGAGAGTVAVWLAERVGPDGQVLATDVEPRHIPSHLQLEIAKHDLNTGPPAAAGNGWDLVHGRLLWMHLHRRREILRETVDALAPGGWLLIEDWAALREGWVESAPDPESKLLFEQVQGALAACFDTRGADPRWARRIHQEMRYAGLVDVDTKVFGGYLEAGSPGMRAAAATIQQLWPRLLEAGLPEADLHRAVELTDDPQMRVVQHPLYSTAGRRPH